MSPVSRQLIVNADDYGRSPGISRGILQAHREPQLAEALNCPDLGIGLHLTFSAWRPVLPARAVPGLLDEDGIFLDQHTLWARAEEIPLDQLRAELAAQVERFVALAGGPPDHLDCHHFAHLYPPFFQVYADLAAGYHLPLRVPFPPEADFRKAAKTLPFLEGFPRDRVRGLIATDSALIRARQLAYPDHFVSTFFGRRALTLDNLLALLEALPEGVSELMCHPGYDDPDLAFSTYRAEREIELALLTQPAVRERVRDLGIELVTFDVLR
jgi:predicted glycoside hydrolase/deacetylase ChbG (UPF0249 family)